MAGPRSLPGLLGLRAGLRGSAEGRDLGTPLIGGAPGGGPGLGHSSRLGAWQKLEVDVVLVL